MLKCVLVAGGADANAACGSKQLCAGLEAGIEAGIGSILERIGGYEGMIFSEDEIDDSIWNEVAEEGEVQAPGTGMAEREARTTAAARATETPLTQECQEASRNPTTPHRTVLVDAVNAFNSGSRVGMLWTTRHRWPRMSRFAFNCYHHQTWLVICIAGASCIFILSKEGVAQGDPLAMVIYGIMLLPLITHLKMKFPEVIQPWFADDGAMDGEGDQVAACFVELNKAGPMFGYYPEIKKSITVCPLESEAWLQAIFSAHDLTVTWKRGQRYLRGHIGSKSMETRMIESRVVE
jgi:hypothetical protein